MKNLSPIKLVPAREMVAVRLREAIMLRELKEGDEITLDGIAQQLNVSITPVREAFQILESDSLIKRRPNKSAIVLGLTRKSIIDHYEARAILESEAAALACKKDADISKLIEIHEKTGELLKKGNTDEYSNYNHIFHYEIWKASGNDKIKALLASLWNGLSMDQTTTETEYAKLSHAEHSEIIKAIQNKDAEKARKLMRDHIKRSCDNILTRFDQSKE